MPEGLPQREPMPWLPSLGERVRFEPRHAFHVPGYSARGVFMLRVWRAGPGHFAVITELGAGLSVTNAAHAVREALSLQFDGPFGLAEHWPAAQSPELGEHVDLVLPAGHPGGQGWAPLWPIGRSAPHYEVCSAWWEKHGEEILSVPSLSLVLPPSL